MIPHKLNSSEGRSTLSRLAGWSDLTPFQQAVLSATHSIPKGEVRTYAQVAEMAAKIAKCPSWAHAARAVGSVMKMNPYAPMVPCHRVVPSDGTLGNYSGKGGPAGKLKLLCQEGYKNEFKQKARKK